MPTNIFQFYENKCTPKSYKHVQINSKLEKFGCGGKENASNFKSEGDFIMT